jgi:hypothetical protein
MLPSCDDDDRQQSAGERFPVVAGNDARQAYAALPTTKFYGERLSVRLDGEVVTAPARLHNDSTHFVPIDLLTFNKNWSMVG